jgi:hypothetical protein
MLEGEATFTVGDEVVHAGPGTYLFGPRDVPHTWEAKTPVRMLYLFWPAGFERFVEEVGVPAQAITPPPADVVPPENAPEIMGRYALELVD